MDARIGKVWHGWPRWEWFLGSLVIVSLVSCSRLGQRMPMAVQDVAFLVAAVMPFLLVGMSWMGLANVRRDVNLSRWRIWMSFCGCAALHLAVSIPVLVVLFPLRDTQWSFWCLCLSVVALLEGIFAPRSVRFPLFFGGLTMGSLVFIIPVSVL